MKILCVGYRDWALWIYSELKKNLNHKIEIITSYDEFSVDKVFAYNPDLVLFYGWSWMVPSKILTKYKCLMLHPSDLPKYRGGSPIQNQIIDGVLSTKLSIFLMTDDLDAGNILGKTDLDLSGDIQDIFSRIQNGGYFLTKKILCGDLMGVPQNHLEATYCKRRLPDESEITLDEIANKSALYLYNKIRMLGDPYPNAYIRTNDGKKLFIKCAKVDN